jgi:two-component system invasion response regulator UvrY
LIKGMGLAEIAAALNLQVSTVSTYKTRIFEKLKVTNVVELAEMVRTYFSDND